MKVYTKTGDSGETALIGGNRVKKNHIRIEAYGSIDELNSFIGLIRDLNTDNNTKATLISIQNHLFNLATQIALEPDKSKHTYQCGKLASIHPENIQFLELEIDKINDTLPLLKHFILPGGNIIVSYCHIARTVCRRAERRMIDLSEQSPLNPLLLKYINRLSDYLFILGRHFSQKLNAEEIKWEPTK